MLYSRLLTSLLLVIALSGCSFAQDPQDKGLIDNGDDHALDEATKASVARPDLKIQFSAADFNEYQMTIDWPARVPFVDLEVNGVFYPNLQNASFTLLVKGGEHLRISFHSRNALKHSISSIHFEEVVPHDIRLSGETTLQENTLLKANRVFLMENTSLFLNAYDLSIEANELHSENATIASFDFLKSAPTRDERKLKNGTLRLVTNKLRGRLFLDISGIGGADGRPGSHFLTPELAARTGLPGKNGADAKAINPHGCGHAYTCKSRFDLCEQEPEDGGPGETGPAGLPGEHGSRGGDTVSLFIRAIDFEQARVTIVGRPGQAGRGGAGSPGFPGGAGGLPGKSDKWGQCKHRPQPGPSGHAGADGTSGTDGVSGALNDPDLPTEDSANGSFLNYTTR